MRLSKSLSNSHSKLMRGRVWCTICNRSLRVNIRECFRAGWPKCHGYTMTIDSPEERRKLRRVRDEEQP